MLEPLKGEDVVDRVGGRFKLCALMQRRLVELMEGARPLVERRGRNDMEVVMAEIVEGKIAIDLDRSTELGELMGSNQLDAPSA
jgi:DNA-directed RNA polymerase subunit omega